MDKEDAYIDDSFNRGNTKFNLILIVLLIISLSVLFFTVYGCYHFLHRSEYKMKVMALSEVIKSKQKIIATKELKIKTLNNKLELMHQSQSLENFLMTLLNSKQKKKVLMLEEWIEEDKDTTKNKWLKEDK